MRLRLTVQRNNLPVSNILWSVLDTASPQAYSFARLLEDVNRVLPLEAEKWGLEDYVIELGGFECLHFSSVLQTLKEDDHISIRPLLTAEVRSRTLCGRTQIAEDGRHLVDGIPFGRPYLRQPLRPAVRIPPRKRLRLDEDAAADAESGEPEAASLLTAAGKAVSPGRATREKGNRKEVHFTQADEDEEDSEDSEDDEDFVPGHVSEGSVESDSASDNSSEASEASAEPTEREERILSPQDDSSDTSSASESDSSSDSSSEDSDANSHSETDTAAESADSSGSESTDTDSSCQSDSDSDRDSDASAPEVKSSKSPVAPWAGSKETRRRNFRRRQQVKLKQLQAEGKLHPEATFADLQAYLGGPRELHSPKQTPAHVMSKSTGKRKRLGEDEVDQDTRESVDEALELERRRAKLMASLADSALDVEMTTVESSATTVEQVEQTISASPSATPAESASRRSTATPTPVAQRLRPNVSAIGRILQRQAVNFERKTPKATKPSVVEEPEPEGALEPDFWKSRVKLSAFECWDEEHELSAPPYPFVQHWDPASQLMLENKKGKQKKKKNRKSQQQDELLIHDNEDQHPEETPMLDYDDSSETVKAGSDPTAAIETQILLEAESAAKTDLPPLPADMNSLPTLQPHNIQIGAVVAFKMYDIDPVTVTPHISDYKTAIVAKEGDSGHGAGTFRLKLADRDVPKRAPRRLDEKGSPAKDAVSSFRMDDFDEDEDESIWEGSFGELVEPKLVKAVK